MMTSLDAILSLTSRQLPEAGVNVVLIGGFAVNYYGYTRNTLDVDFMIATSQFNSVKSIIHADIKPLCDQFGTPAIFEMVKKSVEDLEAS